jgi:hypothetical protein
MNLNRTFALCLVLIFIFPLSAWSSVFIQWNKPMLPPANSLGMSDIVINFQDGGSASLLATAPKQGYRVYIETPAERATAAAKACAKAACAGILVSLPDAEAEKSLASLRSDYPRLRILVLNPDGKQPDMRGSLVIKRNSVLEVSSPTEQPWLDTNLALVRVEERARPAQVPLYTFSWADQGQQKALTADDYSLALAEAGAFHADLLLPLDEDLQQGLNQGDRQAWALWKQVRSMLKFPPGPSGNAIEPTANVAVIFDHLDASDEVLNLLGRHNIPYRVFLASDLRAVELKAFDVVIVFAKPDGDAGQRIFALAGAGSTVVIVDAHGKYPWQNSASTPVNEHTTSYVVGNGKVLELAEPVTDPETFAQDVRRLLGKRNALLSVWNGLTTIAVPYKDRRGDLTLLELVNYAGDPVRLQVQVKGSFTKIRYETPEHGCCQSLDPVRHDGFTEFVIPELGVTGRVHLDPQ